jgi:allophanate hydrolase subunit 2
LIGAAFVRIFPKWVTDVFGVVTICEFHGAGYHSMLAAQYKVTDRSGREGMR